MTNGVDFLLFTRVLITQSATRTGTQQTAAGPTSCPSVVLFPALTASTSTATFVVPLTTALQVNGSQFGNQSSCMLISLTFSIEENNQKLEEAVQF